MFLFRPNSYIEALPAKVMGLWEDIGLEETVRGGIRVLGMSLGSSEGQETRELSTSMHEGKVMGAERRRLATSQEAALAWNRSCQHLDLGLASLQNYKKCLSFKSLWCFVTSA